MKKIIFFLIIAILTISLLIFGFVIDMNAEYEGDVAEAPSEEFKVTVITDQDEHVLVKANVIQWMNGEYSASQLYDVYHSEIGMLDIPLPVKLNFQIEGDAQVAEQYIELSEYSDMTSAKRIDIEPARNFVNIYNLKTGLEYHYRLTVRGFGDSESVTEGTFRTAETPRLLFVDGVRNVRDVGGCYTTDGKKVKQGLLYRGTELRGVMSEKYNITEDGIIEFTEGLGIKSDLDLRTADESGEPVDEAVRQRFYRFHYSYSEIFTPSGMEAVCRVFTDLADKDNYPAYIHCTYGSDRTGTVCYLLHAMLGVSPEDCYKGWELSTFFNGGSFAEVMEQFVSDINAYEGETFKDKVENYLLSCGVTKEQIESIREIFLTD